MYKRNSLTTILIVVITASYLADHYLFQNSFPPFFDRLLLVKRYVYGDGTIIGTDAGQWYRLLTVALTHASWTHLILNMLSLYQLGSVVESFYGRARYSFILLLSLVTASITSITLNPSVVAVGASGMIYGLLSVLLVTGKRMGADLRQMIGVVVINLALGFTIPNVDWHAHVGGLIGGAIATYLVMWFNRPKQSLRNI